jgi:hypothetical protein
VGVAREALKRLVADHEVRLMIATDAACEGLNLQTLGTLINVDLPWNPTRLEQRIGRIKRFGQARAAVDMLNLVHQGTVDETVYARLSERMRNRYDLFGALPDTIRDDWIDDIETLGARMDQYIEARRRATGFDLRYNDSIRPSDDAWRDCATVLARRDVENLMRQGWGVDRLSRPLTARRNDRGLCRWRFFGGMGWAFSPYAVRGPCRWGVLGGMRWAFPPYVVRGLCRWGFLGGIRGAFSPYAVRGPCRSRLSAGCAGLSRPTPRGRPCSARPVFDREQVVDRRPAGVAWGRHQTEVAVGRGGRHAPAGGAHQEAL